MAQEGIGEEVCLFSAEPVRDGKSPAGWRGNATVDTAGYTVTLSGSLSGPGGLTKTDTGTLVLSATNSGYFSGGMFGPKGAGRGIGSIVGWSMGSGARFGTSGSGGGNSCRAPHTGWVAAGAEPDSVFPTRHPSPDRSGSIPGQSPLGTEHSCPAA